MSRTTGERVSVLRTGDSYIDQFAGKVGSIAATREIDDRGYRYTQVQVQLDGGGHVWVNENEVEAA